MMDNKLLETYETGTTEDGQAYTRIGSKVILRSIEESKEMTAEDFEKKYCVKLPFPSSEIRNVIDEWLEEQKYSTIDIDTSYGNESIVFSDDIAYQLIGHLQKNGFTISKLEEDEK